MNHLTGLGEGGRLRGMGGRALWDLARVLAGGAMLLLTGCGTLLSLPLRDGEFYAITKNDLLIFDEVFTAPHSPCGPCEDAFDYVCWKPPMFLAAVIFTPLDAVAETAIAPYDCVLRRMSEFSMTVVDDHGVPVPGAQILAEDSAYDRPWERDRRTDTNGVYRWPMRSTRRTETYRIQKKGFYTTYQRVHAGRQLREEMKRQNTRQVRVVLKAVRDPVRMIHHQVSTSSPGPDRIYGFDLEVGDWVAPHGKGRCADFLFDMEGRRAWEQDRSARVTLSFTNENDGIQEFTAVDPNQGTSVKTPGRWSAMVPPYEALADGYARQCFFAGGNRESRSVENTYRKDRCYLFRVRSEADSDGHVTAANVGWIRRDFEADVGRDGHVMLGFTYYYNPDRNSRSLEAK